MDFDPYQQWLQIPADRRPPTYYDLLGLEEFADDPQVAQAAHRKRYAYVRGFELGVHGEQATRILNELTLGLDCLTDADKKRAYDESLGVRTQTLPAVDAETVEVDLNAPQTATVRDESRTPTLHDAGGDFSKLLASSESTRNKAQALLRHIERARALPAGCEPIWAEARSALALPAAQRPATIVSLLLAELRGSNVEAYCWQELPPRNQETYFHCLAQFPADREAAVQVLSWLVTRLDEASLNAVVEAFADPSLQRNGRLRSKPALAALAERLRARRRQAAKPRFAVRRAAAAACQDRAAVGRREPRLRAWQAVHALLIAGQNHLKSTLGLRSHVREEERDEFGRRLAAEAIEGFTFHVSQRGSHEEAAAQTVGLVENFGCGELAPPAFQDKLTIYFATRRWHANAQVDWIGAEPPELPGHLDPRRRFGWKTFGLGATALLVMGWVFSKILGVGAEPEPSVSLADAVPWTEIRSDEPATATPAPTATTRADQAPELKQSGFGSPAPGPSPIPGQTAKEAVGQKTPANKAPFGGISVPGQGFGGKTYPERGFGASGRQPLGATESEGPSGASGSVSATGGSSTSKQAPTIPAIAEAPEESLPLPPAPGVLPARLTRITHKADLASVTDPDVSISLHGLDEANRLLPLLRVAGAQLAAEPLEEEPGLELLIHSPALATPQQGSFGRVFIAGGKLRYECRWLPTPQLRARRSCFGSAPWS